MDFYVDNQYIKREDGVRREISPILLFWSFFALTVAIDCPFWLCWWFLYGTCISTFCLSFTFVLIWSKHSIDQPYIIIRLSCNSHLLIPSLITSVPAILLISCSIYMYAKLIYLFNTKLMNCLIYFLKLAWKHLAADCVIWFIK